jgi:hypothetical protein
VNLIKFAGNLFPEPPWGGVGVAKTPDTGFRSQQKEWIKGMIPALPHGKDGVACIVRMAPASQNDDERLA